MGEILLSAGISLGCVLLAYVLYVTWLTVVTRKRNARSSEPERESYSLAWLRRVRFAGAVTVFTGAALGAIAYHNEPGFVPRGLIGIACVVSVALLAALIPIPRSIALLYTWPVRVGLTSGMRQDE